MVGGIGRSDHQVARLGATDQFAGRVKLELEPSGDIGERRCVAPVVARMARSSWCCAGVMLAARAAFSENRLNTRSACLNRANA